MPILTASQKLARLKPMLEQAVVQQTKQRRDADFRIWLNQVGDVLDKLYGSDSLQARRIKELPFRYKRTVGMRGVDYSEVDSEKSKTRFQRDIQLAVGTLQHYVAELELELQESQQAAAIPATPLAALHSTVHRVAGKLFANGHYRQAILDTYIALDEAVRQKSQLTGNGTRLMEVAFSSSNPVLKIGNSPDEQQGFLTLFRGAMLAVRNPKAHSLGGTHDAQRALEWLSFASVLLRNLDESELVQLILTPPAL